MFTNYPWRWDLSHPPYSPDLAPSDYHKEPRKKFEDRANHKEQKFKKFAKNYMAHHTLYVHIIQKTWGTIKLTHPKTESAVIEKKYWETTFYTLKLPFSVGFFIQVTSRDKIYHDFVLNSNTKLTAQTNS